MKVYVLVSKDENQPTFNMPVTYGRTIRAYSTKPRAKVYARKFNCSVVEFDTEEGKVVWQESLEKPVVTQSPAVTTK